MKNKKSLILLLAALGILSLCLLAAVGFVIYRLLANPDIQAGLTEVQGDFQSMFALREDIMKTYPAEEVEIKIMNGNVLIISLVNVTNQTPDQVLAQEIAEFAIKSYDQIADVRSIRVNFTQRTQIGPLTTTRSESFSFPVK